MFGSAISLERPRTTGTSVGKLMSEGGLKITASIAENVNLAFYQNAVPFVREVSLDNGTGRDLVSVEVHISSEPSFITPGILRVDRIPGGSVHTLRVIDLKLDHGFLANVTEARRSEIRIRVDVEGERVAETSSEVNLLPPSHWGGAVTAPELLAAFVRPKDPNVDVILREASEKLANRRLDAAIDGYAKKTKARAWEIGEAIWAALVGHGIAYVLPPKSFERHGQAIRGPSDVLTRRVGTCLDLALLYASCLEQAGLNPLVVLTAGHAFAGFWLKDEGFSSPVIDDAQILRKRVQLQEMVLVEATLLHGPTPGRFKQAVDAGAEHVAENSTEPFEVGDRCEACTHGPNPTARYRRRVGCHRPEHWASSGGRDRGTTSIRGGNRPECARPRTAARPVGEMEGEPSRSLTPQSAAELQGQQEYHPNRVPGSGAFWWIS